MKIVLASNNRGKLAELQAIFCAAGRGTGAPDRPGRGRGREPFRTFVENALAKARFASRHTGLPALADDAGMCVDAFGGLPGVDTAYYATQFGYEKATTTTCVPCWSNAGASQPPRRHGQHPGRRAQPARPSSR